MNPMFPRRAVCLFAAAMLLCTALLSSCGGPKPISILPAYMGAPVTDTHHTFTKDDFYVIVSYDDGTDGTPDDYEFEVVGMEGGYYEINFTYEGVENPCYVPVEVSVYPSEMNG